MAVLLPFLAAQAAPPLNDLCDNAEVIPSNATFPFFTTIVANIGEATTTGDPPEPECGFSINSQSIWYKFTPAQDGTYTFSVAEDTATTLPDTVMALYASPAGCGGPFEEVACNDDSGGNHNKSAFEADLLGGVAYFVVVWNFFDEPPDPPLTAVQLKVSRPVPPVNDACSGALVIPPGGPFPFLSPVVETVLAGSTGDPPHPTCQIFGYRSTWYVFTPNNSGVYSISTCQDTATETINTVLGIYTSASGCGGPYTSVACDDNSCGERASVTTSLVAGTRYYIVAWDFDSSPVIGSTDLQIKVTIPPQVTTLAASSITSTGAVIQGSVRPNGLLTRFWFEYGTNTTYESRSPIRLLFGTTIEAVTNHLVAPLLTDKLYHYRMVATNDNGVALGQDHTFLYSTVKPNIANYTGPVNGTFQLRFNGTAGQVYRVEASTDLKVWADIGEATPIGNTTTFQFTDSPTGIHRIRFYRIASP